MHHQVFEMVLKDLMVIMLLGVVVLLTIPVLPYFNSANHPAGKSVFEISDSYTGKQRMTIALAKNLIAQNRDEIIEIIALKKGISLLYQDTPYKQDIQLLISKGVIFSVCKRSVQELSEKLRRPVGILEGVQLVENGHIYAEKLKDSGYLDMLA